jgi:hypothetical protein
MRLRGGLGRNRWWGPQRGDGDDQNFGRIKVKLECCTHVGNILLERLGQCVTHEEIHLQNHTDGADTYSFQLSSARAWKVPGCLTEGCGEMPTGTGYLGTVSTTGSPLYGIL